MEELHKNQLQQSTKFEQLKVELKKNNQQISELKNQQKQLLQQLQVQKKTTKKDVVELKVDTLIKEVKNHKQAFNQSDKKMAELKEHCIAIENTGASYFFLKQCKTIARD